VNPQNSPYGFSENRFIDEIDLDNDKVHISIYHYLQYLG